MTNVTIRGIDDDVYMQFSAEATLRGVSIGDLTTEAMKALIALSGRPVYRIANLENLSVSRKDLESIDGIVIISNIERLEFEPDVDWNIFKDRIQLIENIEILVIPRSISKFQILTKAKNVEKIDSK